MMFDQATMLRRRAGLLRMTRQFFDNAGFIEIQPPCLSADNVVDAHIDPVEVTGAALGLPPGSMGHGSIDDVYYLQSSPEFAMKRLLAGGIGSIYSLGPVFRAGERSKRHNIEFTMLEWYDVGASMDDAIRQTIDLFQQAVPGKPVRVVTYRELFMQVLGMDPVSCALDDVASLVADVDAHLASTIDHDRDAMLDVLLTERIEPKILHESVLIKNYPISQAALARRSDVDPETAERFELIAEGLELANGYGELLDADELYARALSSNERRVATGRRPLRPTSRMLDAMRSGLPACAGVAMGFDRLVMLAIGSRDIADVMTYPIELA